MSNRVRHSLTRVLRIAGLALAAAALFAWHPPLAVAQTLAPADVLRIAQIEQVTNFDPALMSTQDMGVLIDNVYEGLIGTERDTTRLVPRLAEKWTLAPDGKSITFALRKNVKFHDGAALDADAVKYSIERVKTINKGPAVFIRGISAVDVVDKATVRLRVSENPRLALKAMALVMIVSPAALKAHEEAGDLGQKWIQRNSVGTGPYKLGEVKPNERQVYTRFDDYWRGWSKGQVSRVEYIVQLDPAAARLMLERGDVDMTAIYSNDAIEPLRANPQVNVYLKEFPAPQYMMMNTKVKPLDDVRVRRAIQHAWNRAAWKASLGGVVGEQLAPAPLEVLGEDYKAVSYDYDLAKAKQLLTEAGYPNGGFKITHYYLEGDTHKKSMGELLQAELRTLGIQMDIRSLIVARMFEMVRDFGKTKNPASAIDMITIFTPARIFDAHNYLDWHFNSKAWEYGRNFMYYENPEVDRLLAQAAAALDDDKARPLYRQVSDIVMKDAPTIMIERLVGKMYTRKNIEGFYFNLKMYPTTVVFYDIRKR
ncbi:MAG TPA: ABC transporter substrate-binding protein [Methylomirabilota bacterium]